ncbi:hypothetical protein ACQY0O_006366 [Thecaphora frezii]
MPSHAASAHPDGAQKLGAPSAPEPQPQAAPSPPQADQQNLIYSGMVVAVSLALLRAGLWNALLVILAAALLLCNPWVRTLLELPPADASTAARSKFDPTMYLSFGADSSDAAGKDASPASAPSDAVQSHFAVAGGKQLTLLSIAPPLRKPVEHLIKLVVRDFVKYWYDPITFAHPSFPKVAQDSISHFVASIYLRATKLRNVDVTAELLLTSQSVILSSLRRKRRNLQASGNPLAGIGATAPPADADLAWPSSSARIESLRKAVRKLLARNLCSSERQAPVVAALMTEILTKQCWEAVQYVSDPDFINTQIVKWGEPASETSLQDKTLSPKELEAVQNNVDDLASNAFAADPTRLAAQAGQRLDEGTLAKGDLTPADVGKLTPRDVRDTLSDPVASAHERGTAGTISGSDPLATLGGFASSALGSVSNAAGRTFDVVGGGFNELSDGIMGSNIEGAPAHGAPNSDRPSLPPRTLRLDMPAGLSDPPLPDSLKRSLKNVTDNQTSPPGASDAYTISDAAEASPAPATARPVPPLPSRALSASPTKAPGYNDFPTLRQILSGEATSVYEAFEAFLEDPWNRTCQPGEGEAVLRLHTQLGTLSTISQFESLDGKVLAADASNILSKALQRLVDEGAEERRERTLRTSLAHTLNRLQAEPSMATLEPLQSEVIERLEQLYAAFSDRVRTTAPQSSASSVSSTGSTRAAVSPRSRRSQEPLRPSSTGPGAQATPPRPLAYEPRRKNTAPSTPTGQSVALLSQPPSRPPSVPPRPSPAPSRSPSLSQVPYGREKEASDGERAGTAGRRPEASISAAATVTATAAGPSSAASSQAANPSAGPAEVMVTDVSANAGKAGPLDARSLEVMIVVEGMSNDGSSGDGFVLLRRWSEFEALDAELRRLPRSSNPPPRLPSCKGKSSAQFCPELEAYLQGLLASSSMMDNLASNPVLQRFMDKNSAGAPAEAVRERGGPAAFFGGIGKNIVNGVGAVGKTAKTGLGLQSSAAVVALQRSGETGSGTMPARRPAVETPARGALSAEGSVAAAERGADPGVIDNGTSPLLGSASSDTSGFPSRPESPSGQKAAPTAQMSAKDLDQILSAVFAVADEAFNLQGGWTLRRGMLRVLEQVVRTTYSSSLVSTFNEAASALNVESFTEWTEALLGSYWPGDVWSTEAWPERSAEEKQQTHNHASDIIVSYAPAQAGYVLGPGGRAACVEALRSVHETVTDPVTAADLGLCLTLKLLEMASR